MTNTADYPAKVTAALAALNAARAGGDVEAIESAESYVVFALDGLDVEDFADETSARHVLDEEAVARLSDDDDAVILTIDDEEYATITRNDRSTWDFGSSRLFAAVQVANLVMRMMHDETGTDDNAWVVALPLAILEAD